MDLDLVMMTKNITWSGDLLEINGGDIKLGTGGSPTLHISPGDLVTPDIPDSARFPFIAMGNPIPASYDSSNAGIWMGRDPSTTYVPISASLVMVGDEITTACVLASGPEGSGSFLTSSAPRYNFRVGDMTGGSFWLEWVVDYVKKRSRNNNREWRNICI